MEMVRDGDAGVDHRAFIDAVRCCPSENVGGGFMMFPEAVHGPAHDEHDRMIAWYGKAAWSSLSMSSRDGRSSTRTGASAAPDGRRAPRSRTRPVFLRAAAPSSYPSMAARSRLPSATAAAARTPVLSPNPSAIPARTAASPMPMSRGAGEHRERQSLFIDLDGPLGDGMDVHVDARLAAYWAVRWFGCGLFKGDYVGECQAPLIQRDSYA